MEMVKCEICGKEEKMNKPKVMPVVAAFILASLAYIIGFASGVISVLWGR